MRLRSSGKRRGCVVSDEAVEDEHCITGASDMAWRSAKRIPSLKDEERVRGVM
jgi:hypothetical protein